MTVLRSSVRSARSTEGLISILPWIHLCPRGDVQERLEGAQTRVSS
jgi:hypothetical protein